MPMTNKRVFEYEPMQPEHCRDDGADESIFLFGAFSCVITRIGRSYWKMKHGIGGYEAIVKQYMTAAWLRGQARMLLSAADALDAMQAMEQKKKDKK